MSVRGPAAAAGITIRMTAVGVILPVLPRFVERVVRLSVLDYAMPRDCR